MEGEVDPMNNIFLYTPDEDEEEVCQVEGESKNNVAYEQKLKTLTNMVLEADIEIQQPKEIQKVIKKQKSSLRRGKVIPAKINENIDNGSQMKQSLFELSGAKMTKRSQCKLQFLRQKGALRIQNLRQFFYKQTASKYQITVGIQRKRTGFLGLGLRYIFTILQNDFFLFAAERQGLNSFILSSSATRISEQCETFIGKLQRPWMSDCFQFYDGGFDCDKTKHLNLARRHLAHIQVCSNGGPKEIQAYVATNDNANTHFAVLNNSEANVLEQCWERNQKHHIAHLHNRRPKYDALKKMYSLDMEGMGESSSEKNFILDAFGHSQALMMCRKSQNNFVFKLKSPLSLIQAAAICLSCIHS